MNYLFAILPVASAILCVCLGLFTLIRNPRHIANIGFMAGLLCLALIEAGSFLVLAPGMGLTSSGMKLVFAGQALLPSAWLLFTSVFGRANYRDLSRNQRYLSLGTAAASIIFSALVFTPSLSPYFVFEELASFDGTAVFALGPAGKYFYIFLIIGMVVNLVQLETTLRSSNVLVAPASIVSGSAARHVCVLSAVPSGQSRRNASRRTMSFAGVALRICTSSVVSSRSHPYSSGSWT